MNPDLDTLATALYVTIDDLLVTHPQWAPPRPAVGIAPELSDAELVSLAVLQALLGFDSEARFVRYAKAHLTPWFPYVPQRPGYSKRLRRSGELIKHVMACLARACASWHDDVWLVDSTPVECGRSRETQKRSERPGWATYGYSASHSRYFWRLREFVGFGSAGVGWVDHVTRSARAAKLWGLVKPWAVRRRTWRRLLVPSMRPLLGRPAVCQARMRGMAASSVLTIL